MFYLVWWNEDCLFSWTKIAYTQGFSVLLFLYSNALDTEMSTLDLYILCKKWCKNIWFMKMEWKSTLGDKKKKIDAEVRTDFKSK